MRLRHHILVQYSIITFVITIAVAFASGALLGRTGKRHLIEMHLESYPVLVDNLVWSSPQLLRQLSDSGSAELPEEFRDRLEALSDIDSVIRVKLWNSGNQIIWSDEAALVGMKFPEAQIPEKLGDGKLRYEITEPNKNEHLFERESGLMLEIYIPVVDEGVLVGAVELYESNAKLSNEAARMVRDSRNITLVSGLVLYVLLFFIFYKSYRRQEEISSQVLQTESVTIYALAYQAGLRDEETGGHLKRSAEYVRLIAEELARNRQYSRYISREYIRDLIKSAPLHDIGKVGIEDSILRKPGKLTEAEFDRIKEHCTLGARILEEALKKLSFRSFLDIAIQLVRHHHEKWDGTGYPEGLKGDEIPVSAQIMALADVYDALRSVRYYKPAFSHDKSMEIILSERERHFGPAIVDAFMARQEDFRNISESMADPLNGRVLPA
jgi:response regulator RpfG family c-di-GMP phosphodiesterase